MLFFSVSLSFLANNDMIITLVIIQGNTIIILCIIPIHLSFISPCKVAEEGVFNPTCQIRRQLQGQSRTEVIEITWLQFHRGPICKSKNGLFSCKPSFLPYNFVLSLFLKILFSERGEGKEKEREKNVNV